MKKLIIFIIFILSLSCIAFSEITSVVSSKYANNAAHEVTFYDNGRIIAHKIYSEKGEVEDTIGNIPDGIVNRYFSSGRLESVTQYKNCKVNGKGIMYYEDGKLKTEINYKDNKPDGVAKSYYENGQIQTIAYFKAGKRNGTIKAYYKNGVLHLDGSMKDDKNDGLLKEYTEKGYLYHLLTFKNGKMNGKYKFYYENSEKLFQEGSFRDGELDGISTQYSANGGIMTEDSYKNGVLVSNNKTEVEQGTQRNNNVGEENQPKQFAHASYILEACLAKAGGYPIEKNCLYQLMFLEAVQKLEGGYLIGASPAFDDSTSFSGNYDFAFLYTDKSFSQGEILNGYEAYYVGGYSYQTMTGFEKTVPAFKLYEAQTK